MSDNSKQLAAEKLQKELLAHGYVTLAAKIPLQPPKPVCKTEETLAKFISCSPVIAELKQRVRILAPHNISVLILGQTGVGKELIAEALHGNRQGKFVPVNCGGIPSELLEAEFFGAVKGAYTGCYNDRLGYLHEAEGGTLFLDELGELPALMQSKLLRVLESRKFRRVGSTQEEPCNFRLVSATNKWLQPFEDTLSPDFRSDLYFRVAKTILYIPPLTHREQDIDLLIRQFAKPAVADKLIETINRDLKGNVRQLLNIIEEANIFYGHEST